MNGFAAAGYVLLSYLVGSISFAKIIVQARKGIDLRSVGSGNLGATNAARVLGGRWAVVIYLLDFLKGFVPTGVALWVLEDPALVDGLVPLALLAGGAAFAGHCWPFHLRFRGGKGVATGSGVIMALSPLTFAIALLVFAAAVAAFRRVSLGSLLGAVSLPVAFVAIHGKEALRRPQSTLTGFLVLLALAVLVRHRSNIRRLVNGTEPALGRRRR